MKIIGTGMRASKYFRILLNRNNYNTYSGLFHFTDQTSAKKSPPGGWWTFFNFIVSLSG